jgi:mannose-6-phosphate isomerase-like protein (cupin superfamily)
METKKTNLREAFSHITDYFSPRIIGEVNDVYVKLAKVKGGAVPWHSHDREDELFYVIRGRLTMALRPEGEFPLEEGDLFIVPQGTEHRVFCEDECWLLLIENKTTKHTGDVRSQITKSVDEQHY